MRDDDGIVWRSVAQTPAALAMKWSSKSSEPVAALASLRPVSFEVRVEASDGRAAARTFTRRLLAPSVKVRRWRDLSATLYLPESPRAAVIAPPSLACPLLASRGVVVVAGDPTPEVRERLSQVYGGSEGEVVERLPLPLGVPAVASALS